MERNSVLTVGHSNVPFETFLKTLRQVGVELLVDIRSMPGSRHCPWFNLNELEVNLPLHGIGYTCIPDLGGRRSRSLKRSESPNGMWENDSFRNYADYALTEQFKSGLKELIGLSQNKKCAIMCAESVWWKCHRRLVTDNLLAAGEDVFHVMGEGVNVHTNRAFLTRGAVVGSGALPTVTYPLTDLLI